MNDYLNAVMSLQLPFAIFPTIAFSSSRVIMGEFANGFFYKLISIVLSIVVITINLIFIFNQIQTFTLTGWSIVALGKFCFIMRNPFLVNFIKYSILVIFSICYVLFCLYLIIHMICMIHVDGWISRQSFVQRFILRQRRTLEDLTNEDSVTR
jgi:hypothetical protein